MGGLVQGSEVSDELECEGGTVGIAGKGDCVEATFRSGCPGNFGIGRQWYSSSSSSSSSSSYIHTYIHTYILIIKYSSYPDRDSVG